MPPDQPPPQGRKPGPGATGTTHVGRLPWLADDAQTTPATGSPLDAFLPGDACSAVVDDPTAFDFATRPAASPRPARGRGPAPPASRPDWLDALLGPEEAGDFRRMLARIRGRIDAAVMRSPPFTVSLCVHAIGILVLALLFVRFERKPRRPIDLSFAATARVEAEQPGVQVVEPAPESEPEPEVPSEVQEPEKAVEDPIAAPEVVEAETVEALGAEPAPAVAPAIGTLLQGREAGQRARLVAAYGGSDATEAAVAKSLDWLARQQGKDGLWSLQGPYLDGANQENKLAATAMALLAFQGAGNTPKAGAHKRTVAAAWTALLKRQVVGNDAETDDERRRSGSGRFEISLQDPPERQGLYAHAQATIALCELYGMTQDRAYEQPARRAVAYAVAAQGRNGGWRYEPGQDGDMSVTGWYMMALKSAQMAGLDVPAATFANLGRFLDAVSVDGGRRYGYRFDEVSRPVGAELVRNTAGPVTEAVSAEGLLCRQYLGWPQAHPALAAGVDVLLREKFLDWETDKDVYAWYYITQVVHHLGGPRWERWNGRMKDLLPAVQVGRGTERGSWDPALDKWGPWGGRLFTTCFCTYMLEVYYRHLPLYGEQAVVAAP